ncbi:uncharacterized protein LOC143877977 [Tasmannia lanceolata]|uniref:uncharacterized protein LOC143877977 n=1 Tax=Tasmannia lanceolata TaxID=3420 RepID=UPI004063C78C
MDFSSLTEAQQQQILAQHQQQQQEQQPQPYDQSTQPYDPAYAQTYDQSTQSYYPYPQSYQNPNPNSQQFYQQPYPYHSTEYPNATVPSSEAAANAYQQPTQHDSNPQPHNLSIPPEASQILAAAGQQILPQEDQNSYQVPPGLNPAAAAAVAALSQLTQFAGKMDAAERAMAGLQEGQWQPKNDGGYGQMTGGRPHQYYPAAQYGPVNVRPPVGRSPYRGGGRRGGGSFRGGRSNFGPHYPRPDRDSRAPPVRGRGRTNRGGGRRFSQPSSAAPSYPPHASEPPSEPAAPPAAVQVPPNPKTPVRSQAPPSAPAQITPLVTWCELCMVDCNTVEILEQHKNGRRHKKTVQRYEELQNHKKLISESQAKVPEPSENVQVGEENKAPTQENLSVAASTDENGTATEQQNQTAEQSEVAKVEPTETPAGRPRFDSFDRRYAPKRNMKYSRGGGRGGKRMRMSEVRSDLEQPKEPPKYCALCSVTCDTQVVLERHLAGKKHTSNVKRSQGPQGIYRPLGLHSLYMPHTEPTFIPQGQYQPVIYGSQGQETGKEPLVQQEAYEHQIPPQASYQHHQAQPDGEPKEVILEPEGQQSVFVGPEGQDAVMTVTVKPEGQNVVTENFEDQSAVNVEPDGQNDFLVKPEGQQSVFVGPEGQDAVMTVTVKPEGQNVVTENFEDQSTVNVEPEVKSEDQNAVLESEVMEFTSVPDDSIPASENATMGAENDVVSILEYGGSSAELDARMGLEIKVDESGSNKEEPTNQDADSQET